MKHILSIALAVSLASCGSDSRNFANSPPPPVSPPPAEIRGVLDQAIVAGAIPSSVLPSAVIPSAAIPSMVIPSGSLPSAVIPSASLDGRELDTGIAGQRMFVSKLTANQEVVINSATFNKASNLNASAIATLLVDTNTNAVSGSVSFENIDLDDTVSMVHIHASVAGSNGPVILGLVQNTTNSTVFEIPDGTTIADFIDVEGNDFNSLFAAGWYFNLHTESNPAGQLRGQIIPEDRDVVRVELQTEQEVPRVIDTSGTNVSAVGYITFSTVDAAVLPIVNVLVRGFEATAAHIHRGGFAGDTGPVQIGLTDISPVDFPGSVFTANDLPIASLEGLRRGGYYFNVHSALNPAGEVRGQITSGDTQVVRVILQTEQEVPVVTTPVADDISGVGYFTFNQSDATLPPIINLSITGFEATAAHIHRGGFAGAAGPVQIGLVDISPADEPGTVFTSDSGSIFNLEALSRGAYYFNAHSAVNPAGELRGQITPGTTEVVRVELQTEQTVPAVDTAIAKNVSGVGYFTFDAAKQEVAPVINLTVHGFEATAAHIHRGGFAGRTGPVQISLVDVSPVDAPGTIFTRNDGEIFSLEGLNRGAYYFNAHTVSNPAGEIRGQITAGDTQVVRVELQAEQEVPAIINPIAANVNAVGYFTFDASDNTVSPVANVRIDGFSATAVHVHQAAFAGTAGPVQIELTDVSLGNSPGTLFSSSDGEIADLAGLLRGAYYFNAHSDSNPAGEVRGQITAGNTEVVRVELQTEQEIPIVTSTAASTVGGVGYITFDTVNASVSPVANIRVTGFEATMAHIHRSGFAGATGPVQIGLTDSSPAEAPGSFFVSNDGDIASLNGLLRGGYYFNTHSEANPAGEVRGQITPGDIQVVRVGMQSEQEVPAVVSPVAENIEAIAYFTFDALNPLASPIANVSVSGFQATAVHVHRGGFAGTAGPVQIGLTDISPEDEPGSLFTSADGQIASIEGLLRGGYYVNAHSEANPAGELRGQITAGNTQVVRVELQTEQEVPAVITPESEAVSALAYFTYDQMDATIPVVANLSVNGFEATAAHIHRGGFAGTAGPVQIGLTDVSPEGAAGTLFTSNNGQIASLDGLHRGGYYFNVHSETNPSGEVRGQITAGNTVVLRSEMQTQQEVPAVTLAAADNVSGVGYFTFDPTNPLASPVTNIRVSGFEATAAHIHRGGFAGTAGPVQIGLSDTSPVDAPGTFFSSDEGEIASLDGLLSGGYYFNAHSEANSAGEVRGQLLDNNTVVLRTDLTGDQAIPANQTSATGIGYLTLDINAETFRANVQVINFEPLPSAVTINVGADNNVVFSSLTINTDTEGFFNVNPGPVNSLNGLLNGAYSLQAVQ